MSGSRKHAYSNSEDSSSSLSDNDGGIQSYDPPPTATEAAPPNLCLDETEHYSIPAAAEADGVWTRYEADTIGMSGMMNLAQPHSMHDSCFSIDSDQHRAHSLQLSASRGSVDPLTIGLSGSMDLGGRHTHYNHSGGGGGSPDFLSASAPSTTMADSGSYMEAEQMERQSSLPEFEAEEKAEEESDSDSNDGRKKGSPAFRPRGRKKRNKCSPEQLAALEAFFAKNRNPTGRVREELSKKLKMPERSVQVWFQNRRAKVKVLERRGLDPNAEMVPKKAGPSQAASTRSSGSGHAKQAIASKGSKASGGSGKTTEFSENSPSVTALPTTALCIGSWRRVSPLVCFFSRRLQTLTWYLSSDSMGFKLETPWTSIKSVLFEGPTAPTAAERWEGVRHPLGHLTIELERPPTFFMEVFRSGGAAAEGKEEPKKACWRQCSDFTEGRQATLVNRHVLSGPYEELRAATVAFSKTNEVLERLVEFRDLSSPQQQQQQQVPPPSSTPLPGVAGALGLEGVGMAPMSSREWAPQSVWHDYRSSPVGTPWELHSPVTMLPQLPLEPYQLSANSSHSSFHDRAGAGAGGASPGKPPFSSLDLTGLRLEPGASVGSGSGSGSGSSAHPSASFQAWDAMSEAGPPPPPSSAGYAWTDGSEVTFDPYRLPIHPALSDEV